MLRTKNSQKLLTIFLIVLSGCANKIVTVPIQQLDMVNGLVDYRELYFDDKKKTMTSKLIKTEPIGANQHKLIGITPEIFNQGFVEWQKLECKKK